MNQWIQNMIARCRVLLSNSGESQQMLQVQLTADETKDDIEHVEPFGFTARPQGDAEGVALFFGGDRSHGVVIMVNDRRHRVTDLAEGESAHYNAHGLKLVLYEDRAELVCPRFVVKADEEVFFDTPLVRSSGDIVDRAGAGGASMAAMRALYDGHTHPETGGETAAPSQKTT